MTERKNKMAHISEYMEDAMKEIERLQKLAAEKQWKQPRSDDYFGIEVWARYWKAMEESEANPDLGRPVPPHRSG